MPHKDPEARRAYYRANRAKIAAKQKAWTEANKDKVKAWADAYKDRRKAIDAKPEHQARRREYARQYHRDHPEKWQEHNKEIKAKRADTEPTNIRNRVLMAGRPKPKFCELCGRPPGQKGLMFDHCHQHGHFRGWICTLCNLALGYVSDDVQILRKMIAYLERNRTNTAPQLTLAGI
jgi:hypothetical protein